MQIVIEIPNDQIPKGQEIIPVNIHFFGNKVLEADGYGFDVLPKGHGRLIDVGDLMPDSDYEDGIFYAVSVGQINGVPTIVEADKEDKE